jgi:Tol biopolymer transport system component
VMPADNASAQPRLLTSADANTNFTWTREGKIISDESNRLNVIDPVSGSKSVMAMQGLPGGAPLACGDGHYILYDVFDGPSGNQNIFRMDTTGGDVKQLTSQRLASLPACSPDNRWAYYISQSDEEKLARVSIDGGSPQMISELPVSGTFGISPDGKIAVFPTLEHSGGHQEMLAVVDIAGGKTEKMMPVERPRFGLLHFATDGKAVVYPARGDNGADNLWLQPLDGSKGHALTSFTSERIYDFHWSFDGKQLALVRGHNDADVVLIRDAGQ